MTKKPTVLIVDDIKINRELLKDLLSDSGYDSFQAANGKVALDMIEKIEPDLILLDIVMPVMDGFETLVCLKSNKLFSDIPILIISATEMMDDIIKGIELGADDVISKPFKWPVLKARVNSCVEKRYLREMEKYDHQQTKETNIDLINCVKQQKKDIIEAQIGTIYGMSKIANSLDENLDYNKGYVQEYCKAVAIALANQDKYKNMLDDDLINSIYIASQLHNISKIGIPKEILRKPEKLTLDEFDCLKVHLKKGAKTIYEVYTTNASNELLCLASQIAGSLHEKWDGTGYPYALKGEEIPLCARIFALVDVYDALTSDRPYRKALSHDESKKIIMKEDGKYFDPDIVKAFVEVDDTFLRIRDKYNK